MALRDLATDRDRACLVFGAGLFDLEINQSLFDSAALVGPIAFVVVVAVLAVIYRDPFDILLGVAGIVLVLLWLFGFISWTGISFNQFMIPVPVLLIGLSIDFALHVFICHRKHHSDDAEIRSAIGLEIGGVVVALAWVTATTAIGFLSNLVSPIAPLREFGVASARYHRRAGDIWGARAGGEDRTRRVSERARSGPPQDGVRDGRRPAVAAPRDRCRGCPVGTAGGARDVGCRGVRRDTARHQLPGGGVPRRGPARVDTGQELPGPFTTSEYHVIEYLNHLQGTFQQVGREGELLIRGDVTDDRVLTWLDSAAENASDQRAHSSWQTVSRTCAHRSLRVTAALNPDSAFNESLASYSGIPTENISGLYGGMTGINPAASEVVYEEAGEYEAIRMQVGIHNGISQEVATADLRQITNHIEAVSGGELSVVTTGDLVVNNEIEGNLLQTVTEGLILTLVSVFLSPTSWWGTPPRSAW